MTVAPNAVARMRELPRQAATEAEEPTDLSAPDAQENAATASGAETTAADT
jgi:hypothetical protein